MGQIYLLLILMLLCTCASMAAGYGLAKAAGRTLSVLMAGLVTAGMLLFARYWSDSVWITHIVPVKALPVFGNWLPLLAGLLAGIGWVISPRKPWMKAAVLGLLLLSSLCVPYRPLFADRPQVRSRWYRGVCIQTTSATCGAAAAATLLRTLGIHATEQEMVDLCFTTWRGTSLHGLLYGISQKLDGTRWRVSARDLTISQLFALPDAAILQVGLPDQGYSDDPRYQDQWGWIPGVLHTAVYLQPAGPDSVDMGDPATGRERWSTQALKVLWNGTAITIEPRPQ